MELIEQKFLGSFFIELQILSFLIKYCLFFVAESGHLFRFVRGYIGKFFMSWRSSSEILERNRKWGKASAKCEFLVNITSHT